jgi:hypothetical protein
MPGCRRTLCRSRRMPTRRRPCRPSHSPTARLGRRRPRLAAAEARPAPAPTPIVRRNSRYARPMTSSCQDRWFSPLRR